MPGEFQLTGGLWQLVADSADPDTEEDQTALAGLQGYFISNIPEGVGIPTDGGILYVPQREFVVMSDGQIGEVHNDDSVTAGMTLLANDPALGLDNPVQWTVKATSTIVMGGRPIRPQAWTFQAPIPGTSRTLDQLAPVPVQKLSRGPAIRVTGGSFNVDDDLVLTNEDGSTTSPIVIPSGTLVLIDNGDGTASIV